jgi:hypothetical protein
MTSGCDGETLIEGIDAIAGDGEPDDVALLGERGARDDLGDSEAS